MDAKPVYAIREVAERGKGLVAVEDIPKGTRILSEEPLITVPQITLNNKQLRKSICKQVDALGQKHREAFLSLHNTEAYTDAAEQYLGIIRTNALPIGSSGHEGGIFLEASRINHACCNNAQKSWNENIGRHTVHALRDITKGEEITIYYLSMQKGRKARQEALRNKFSFVCSCRLCSLPPEQSEASDKRLESIHRLDTLVGSGGIEGIVSSPLRILRYVDEIVRCYNEQGPDDSGLSRAYFDAAQIVLVHGDLARGHIFAQRAISGWMTSLGDDSTEVIEHGTLLKAPAKHKLFGMTMEWKSGKDDIPTHLEPSAFEDWLWKRKKEQRALDGLADLRCRKTFPSFTDLPERDSLHLDYHKSSGTGKHQPRRHWCFFAEIIDFYTLTRLQMDVSDVKGDTIPLFFYTTSHSKKVAPTQIQKGYTITVLYIERHDFLDGRSRIYLKDSHLVKVL